MDVSGSGAGPSGPGASGLPEAAAGFAIGLVLSSVGVSVGSTASGYHPGGGAPLPLGVTVGGVLGLWLGLVGAVVIARRRSGAADLRAFVGLRIAGPLDLVGGAAVGLACQYLLIPLLYLLPEQFDPSLAHQLSAPARQDTGAVHGAGAAAVVLVVLGVGAPFVEELFFRGLVLRSIAGRHRPAVAVVVTALLFALAHFQAVQFAGLAAFGIVLGVLAHRTGRLGPSMAAHAAFNAAAVVSLLHLH